MVSEEFRFNFKFKLHKSNIRIGLGDEDYERLSVAYGVPMEDVMSEVERCEASNRSEAQILLDTHPDAPQWLDGKRITFMGDSITSDRFSYFNVIREAMEGRSTVQLQDHSISAYKLVDIITNYCPVVTDFKPDIVHVLIGVNDLRRSLSPHGGILISVEEYTRQLRFLISEMQLIGAKLIFSTLSPIDYERATTFSSVNSVFLEKDRIAYNDAIRQTAKEMGCIVNDMEDTYRQYSASEITEPDGLHLNVIGQRLLAEKVLGALENC